MIVNEELGYVLETIRFKTSIYRDKKKKNLSFNDDDYYSNILNEYITDLQQENARLKDEIEKVIEYANSDEFEQLFESCANFNEANCNINHFLKEN